MQQTCSKLEELAKHKILVLDLAYQPIAVINWEKAMYLWLSNKADVLNFYENLDVNSPNDKFQLPAVLRVRWLGKKRQKQHVHFSRWSVLARDNFMCAYCGNHFPEDKLTLDHVVPFSHGEREVGIILFQLVLVVTTAKPIEPQNKLECGYC